MMVNFDCSETDRQLIVRIADRFMELCTKYKTPHNRTDIMMDLTACHCNGCRLNLVAMSNGDDFNLLHDVCGITRHIDRATGKLEGFFLPRYALKDRSNNTKNGKRMKIIIEIDEKKLQKSVRKEFGEEVLPIDIYLMQNRIYNFDQPPVFSKMIYRLAALCWGLVRNPDALPKKEHIQ